MLSFIALFRIVTGFVIFELGAVASNLVVLRNVMVITVHVCYWSGVYLLLIILTLLLIIIIHIPSIVIVVRVISIIPLLMCLHR